jgi:CHAD domain-containing protein
VRDLDVKLEQLRRWRDESQPDSHTEFDHILIWATRSRHQARRRMIRVLDSRRFNLLIQRLALRLERPLRLKLGQRLGVADVLPDLIRPLYRQVIKAGRRIETSPEPEDYHRLRLRCKRLRYALEFASCLYGKTLRPHRKRLVRLQNVLGDYNDTIVARANIRNWIEGPAKALPPSAILFLGALDERLRCRGESCLEKFPDRFRDLTKRPWRSLARALHPRGGGTPS